MYTVCFTTTFYSQGLTWAERTDRDLYTHSDSDVFLKSNTAAASKGGKERVCAGTDIDDPWNSETDSRPLTLNKKSPLPKRKDSFEKRYCVKNFELIVFLHAYLVKFCC